MRQLRTNFCAFSFVASVVALLLHLGFDLWGCASCSFVNDLPVSSVLAWLGPVLTAILAIGCYFNKPWSGYALCSVAAISVGLVAWMVSHGAICAVCMMVHAGLIAAALTLVPRVKFLATLFFAGSVVFAVTGGFERYSTPRGTTIFSPRPREVIPAGKVYVLFTDPECSRCKMVEQQIDNMPAKPNVLYRWTLLPQNTYRSIRVATMLEMAKLKGTEFFEKLRVALLKRQPPYTDAVIEDAGQEAGLGDEIKSWLDFPADSVLIDIQRDETASIELKIESLPALAELSPPDKSGTRMLRLVSLREIGIRP